MIKLRGSSIPTIILELCCFSFVSYHAKLTDVVTLWLCHAVIVHVLL